MGANILYPDGSELTSTALTIPQIGNILQPLTLGMLGQTVADDNPAVRIEWPTQGAPFQDEPDDVCYLRCTEASGEYSRIRDRSNESAASPNLQEVWTYTRIWKIRWCCYGPNAFDNIRAIRSALYQDYFTNAMEQSQLFPMSDFPDPVRAPELIDGQWWDRADFEIEMYEFVTETITRQTVLTAEVIVENDTGVIADFTVTA